MNLPTLIENFRSEDKCREYLENLRWPRGVECPRCGGTTISRIVKRNQFDCDSCRYQFSVTAGTLFHDSHLPLWKWFLAVYLMAESKKGISAKQLQRMLGTSYKTAWYLAHRIRNAMGEDDQPLLRGIVEADETFIGGHKRGGGSGSHHKTHAIVVGAVERDGEVRLKLVDRRNKKNLHAFIEKFVDPDAAAVYTDENPAWDGIATAVRKHGSISHGRGEYARGDVDTNTVESVWSLFKRGIVGSYHQISVKHLPAYLDEMEFRYNGRENPYLFRDTLLVLLNGDALPLKTLVHGAA